MNVNSISYWQKKASRYITGGMSSNFRANRFTGKPMFAQKAVGPRFWDVEGREYIDFFMCHGAVLLGHHHRGVHDAVQKSLEKGFFAGFESKETIEFAKKICSAVPAAEEIRFVNSGSEGTLLAMRIARGYTGKNVIIRIDGHFHGVNDYLLSNNIAAKRDQENDGTRISKTIKRTSGVPAILDQLVIIIPWNNVILLEKVLRDHGEQIAGIIMNPIDYNNGCFTTSAEYLKQVRTLADQNQIVLIFDEILSGFKTGISCAQGYYGVVPDLCTLGKALSNGVPLSIVAGKSRFMQKVIDPVDPVVAGGTYSGNQLGIAAGNAVMDTVSADTFYEGYLKRASQFYVDLQKLFHHSSIPAYVCGLGAGFYIYIGTREAVETYEHLNRLDSDLERRFFSECMRNGVYFHTDFTVSASHDHHTLQESLNRIETVVKKLKHSSSRIR